MSSIPPNERVNSDFQAPTGEEPVSQSESTEPLTLQQRFVKFLKGLLGWVSVIILLAVPSFAGYAVGYGVAFGWSVLLQGYEFYKYRTGSVKVWPKILDVGILTLSLILLIIEVTLHPNDEFHKIYSGIVVNGALALIVLFSIAVRRPFTLQFAQENVPKERWNHPGLLWASYITAWFWFGVFDVSVLVQTIPIMAGDSNAHDTLSLVCGTILPLVVIFLGFKGSDELVKLLKKKGQEKAAKEAATTQAASL